LETVLSESPLRKEDGNKHNNKMNECTVAAAGIPVLTVQQHMDYLVPNCVPKNRHSLVKGREARNVLLRYIADMAALSLITPLRNGRSLLHTACFYGDVGMTKTILEALEDKAAATTTPNHDAAETTKDTAKSTATKKEASTKTHKSDTKVKLEAGRTIQKSTIADVDVLCLDSGWSPYMYACLAGSLRCTECLFRHGAQPLSTVTNDTHTWHVHHGKGLTAKELVESVLAGTDEKEIETHGMALSELKKDVCGQENHSSLLKCVLGRIAEIEAGDLPWTDEAIGAREEVANATAPAAAGTAKCEDVDDTSSRSKSMSRKDSVASANSSTPTHGTGSKKGKKKKNKDAPSGSSVQDSNYNGNIGSESEPPETTKFARSSSSSTCSKAKDDPLVTALMGMGFTEDQIMMGVEACGGIDRATADDVVARIFGQEPEPLSPQQQQQHRRRAAATTNMQAERSQQQPKERAAESGKSTVDHSSTQMKEAIRSRQLMAIEAKRQEALKKVEDERLAAERLAAKREEQRRRNREWNKKRQLQDVQAKLPKAPIPRVSLLPGSNYLLPASTALKAASNAGNAGYMKQPSNIDGSIPTMVWPYDNDNSTIASSLENFSVAVDNDDATISTLGSVPRTVPPPATAAGKGMAATSNKQPQSGSSPQVAPPGFGSPSLLGSMPVLDVTPAHHQRYNEVGSESNIPGIGPSFLSSVVTPPGIPESQPLLVSHELPSPFASHSLGHGQGPPGIFPSRLATAEDTISGFNHQVPSLLSTQLPTGVLSTTQAGPSTYESPSLFTGTSASGYGLGLPPPIPSTLGPATRSVSEVAASSMAPRPIGFGLEHHNKSLDSSVIDSISTGDGMLPGGSSLWGTGAATGSGQGSSLLGNLIQNSPSSSSRHELSDTTTGLGHHMMMGNSQPLFLGHSPPLLHHAASSNSTEWLTGRASGGGDAGLPPGSRRRPNEFHRTGSGSIW